MTAEPSVRELTLADRIAYTRAHLPDEWREGYEGVLREATEVALNSGDYGRLVDVVEQWWRAARLEHHGGEGWQRQKRLIAEGRWDELFPGPPVDVDAMLRETRP